MAATSKVTTLYDTDPESTGLGELKFPTPQIGQGPADPISPGSLEAKNNEHGYTHPDLHRTIDPADPQNLSEAELESISPGELEPRQYSVGIYGLNSFRTTHKIVHTEEEFIREAGKAAMSPLWNEHNTGEDAYTSGGDSASWEKYPPKVNPLSRGTPDEIP